MQNAVAWDLMLELWQPLDQRVVLRLMCCSKSMMELVHSKCAGMLPLKVSAVHDSSSPPAVLTSWPQHHALGRWLANHARLCSSIGINIKQGALPRMQPRPPTQDGLVTLGGGPPSLYHAHPAFRVLEASAAAGMQAAAGSSSSSSSSSSSNSVRPLPLTRFSSSLPSNGSILPALAGCPQLTYLQLRLEGARPPEALARAALARLTSLQQLSFTGGHTPSKTVVGYSQGTYKHTVFDALQPALHALTNLTSLSLSWSPGKSVTQKLPVSIVELGLGERECKAAWQLAHLTRVTELRVPTVPNGGFLPPALHTLKVADTNASAASLVPLAQQRRLHWKVEERPDGAVLRELQAVTQLTHIGLSCMPPYLSTLVALPELPLKQLHMGVPCNWRRAYLACRPVAITWIGNCTQLTSLSLSHLGHAVSCVNAGCATEEVTQLASALTVSTVCRST